MTGRSMIPRTSRAVTAGLAAIAFIFGWMIAAASLASAHTSTAHYPSEWPNDVDYNIGYRHSGFTGSDFRDAVQAADDPWDSVSGNWFDFNWGTTDTSVTTWGGCLTVPTGGVWVGTGNISSLGSESTCSNNGDITRSSITIDRLGPNWYMGSSTSVPVGEYDLRSTLVHEFGHATGFAGHFVHSSITDCVGFDRNTMCENSADTGEAFRRSLESHDEHTVAAAY